MPKENEQSLKMNEALIAIHAFLPVRTPCEWVRAALDNVSVLMIDHANCEKKAASTAMSLLYRYIDRQELLQKMSQLAREELLHFEQVLALMQTMDISYEHVSPGRYASGLHKGIRSHEPARLVDSLIVGAIVEARSCERFHILGQNIGEPLAGFYLKLLVAEGRHFQDYLELAKLYCNNRDELAERIEYFLDMEADLILKSDSQFRFLSGHPT